MMVLSCSNLKFVVSEVSQELTLNSQTEIERHNIIFWLRGQSTNTHKHIYTHSQTCTYICTNTSSTKSNEIRTKHEL